jgi:hypothetical protein
MPDFEAGSMGRRRANRALFLFWRDLRLDIAKDEFLIALCRADPASHSDAATGHDSFLPFREISVSGLVLDPTSSFPRRQRGLRFENKFRV